MRPTVDSYIAQQIDDTKDQVLKTKMLFFLAAHYELQGQERLAQTYYSRVQEEKLSRLIVTRLAAHRLKQYRN
jgi:hypothetical protein